MRDGLPGFGTVREVLPESATVRVDLPGLATVQKYLLAFATVQMVLQRFGAVQGIFRHCGRFQQTVPHCGQSQQTVPPGRPKTALRRADPAGAAAARFLTPRSLRKRPSCLKSGAPFPVQAVWHPAFAQVGGSPVRPRVFRAEKIKHEGRFRSERGVQNVVSAEGAGDACLDPVFGQPPARAARWRLCRTRACPGDFWRSLNGHPSWQSGKMGLAPFDRASANQCRGRRGSVSRTASSNACFVRDAVYQAMSAFGIINP